jgi:hypothetical protein
MMRRVLAAADLAILGVVAFGSIVIAIADYFGLLPNDGPLAAVNYESMIIVLLGAIGLHIVYSELERRREPLPDLVRGQADRTIRSLSGMAITVFDTSEQMERYLARRIGEARDEVCDLSWKGTISHGARLTPRKKSQAAYEASIDRASGRIKYREVFAFNDERRLDKLERRLAKGKPGYSCAYYAEHSKAPRLQFVVIDKEELIFASSAYPRLCAIRHIELCEIFQSYYEEVWANAIPLVDGGTVVKKEVEIVRSQTRARLAHGQDKERG